MLRTHYLIILMSIFALALAPAGAAVLAPGDCVGLNNITCPGFVESFTGSPGTFITGKTVDILNGGFNGPLASAVFLNPNGTTLDFYYQFTNNVSSTQTIGVIANRDFAGFITDVGTRKDAIGSFGSGPTAVTFGPGNADATHIDRFGGVVEFRFGTSSPYPFPPGQASSTLIIKTDATAYTEGLTSLLADFANDGAFTFQPAASVPEASTFPLGAVGLTWICCWSVQQRIRQRSHKP